MQRFGGLARRTQLVELGHSPRGLSRAISAEKLVVPRRGWLCSPEADANAVRAISLGGKLGGSSALRSYGVWADGTDLVVSTPSTAGRVPATAAGERRVWMDERFPHRADRQWRVSILDALLQHATRFDRPSLIASVDSAMNIGILSPHQLRQLVAALPRRLRRIRREVDGRAMSGTETKLRLACMAAGLRVELQAPIDRVGFVDLLVDGWLVVEVDSRQHHGAPIRQHVDRIRDGNAVLGAYGNLRFDYELVQFQLEWCIRVIRARLGSGRPEVGLAG